MNNVRSKWGAMYLGDAATPIDSLEVAETNAGTVQLSVGFRNYRGDQYGSVVMQEICIELDPVAAGALAEKLAAKALDIAKRDAASKLVSPN